MRDRHSPGRIKISAESKGLPREYPVPRAIPRNCRSQFTQERSRSLSARICESCTDSRHGLSSALSSLEKESGAAFSYEFPFFLLSPRSALAPSFLLFALWKFCLKRYGGPPIRPSPFLYKLVFLANAAPLGLWYDLYARL
jgi:hypothetical protein